MRARLLVPLLLLAVAGCSSGGSRAPGPVASAPSTSAPAPVPAADARALVGRWAVRGPGVAPGTVLDLGPQALVYLACGEVDEIWAASPSGVFAAYQAGFSQACLRGGNGPSTPWLEHAQRFTVTGERAALLDGSGRVLAALTRDPKAAPKAASGPAPTYAPSLQPLTRPAPALPSGVAPATAAALAGRWLAVGEDVTHGRGYVAFTADGSWSGSDGCNAQAGRYALGERGEVLVVSGASTLIGCPTTPAPGWVAGARALGLQAGQLVLVGADGKVLGRLRRP